MVVTFVVLLGFWAGSAAEQANAKTTAQTLLDHGLARYDRGDFAGALAKFIEAYAVYPSPKLWFNVGQAEQALHHPIEALSAFERFLKEATDVPPATEAEARATIAQLQRKLTRLRIGCSMAGAEIWLDGVLLGESPLAKDIWTVAGQHIVSARSPAASARETVTAMPGERVSVYLEPIAPSSSPQPRSDSSTLSATLPSPGGAPGRAGWWLGRRWTWVAAGVAVASAAGATTFGLLMTSRYHELQQSCGSASAKWPGCSDSDLRSLDRRKDTANVLWGAAGAATLAATVLFIVEGRAITVSPTVGRTVGVAARMRF